jgi:hypothetical protein
LPELGNGRPMVEGMNAPQVTTTITTTTTTT